VYREGISAPFRNQLNYWPLALTFKPQFQAFAENRASVPEMGPGQKLVGSGGTEKLLRLEGNKNREVEW